MESLRSYFERFLKVPDGAWERIQGDFEQISFSRKEVLTRPGERESYLYFIGEGILRGYHIRKGQEFNVGFSLKGDPSGVIDSFITGKPSRYFLEAIKGGEAARISRQCLLEAYEAEPALEKWGRVWAETLLVGIADREVSFLTLSAEERFAGLMARNPAILNLISQKHLASYLGMSPETFSRLRARHLDSPS